jgi:energy-coupling factor transporter ATP-binding protein EcfA2
MEKILNQLETWFADRPLWLQDAARRIIQKGAIDAGDLDELTALCKQEAGVSSPTPTEIEARPIPEGALSVHESPISLCLEEISDVRGINALSPRNPLKLSEAALTVIYGTTGSGKSGYVRILKHACGARKTGTLHGNVFDNNETKQGCTFKVKLGDERKDLPWSPDMGVLNDMRTVEVYDTDCAHVYLTEENEVAYEPWILSLFTQLTEICTHIGQTLKTEIDVSVPKILPLPFEFQGTNSANWYSGVGYQTTQKNIDILCLWTPRMENALTRLNGRLSEPDSAKQAQQLRTTKKNRLTLHDELKKIRDKFSDEKCTAYLEAKKEAVLKRKAADEDAKKVFENAPLEGGGSESWRLLWEQARNYSENVAYTGIDFPNISEDARCVLCQQLLEKEAKQRFESFEDFVKGELQKLASKAETNLNTIKENIENILSAESLKLYLGLAGIAADAERETYIEFHKSIIKRKDTLLKADSLSDVAELSDDILLKKLKSRCKAMEKRALEFDEDAKSQDRSSLRGHIKELEARKWLSGEKSKIEQEVARLKHINVLNKARRSTNPQVLSVKKSSLSDILISPAFIERFERELKTLGASRIKVELNKTRTEYGRVFHKVQLKNCDRGVCTTDILSEGEFRIVSLATFLADITGQPHITPFIFDDPISSLDQDFEEATAQRLIELSGSRQVIVFTHRLSLLALLEAAADNAGINYRVICLRSESWGTGDPGETPLFAKRPDRALKSIKNERLARARKTLNEQGRTEYESLAKGICSDIRILIERIIEVDLLSDVIQRFRRAVHTQNKIKNLAKIDTDDCKLLDEYMTKYSKYLHSQSQETPVQIPDPDEIEDDLNTIIAWLDDFKRR